MAEQQHDWAETGERPVRYVCRVCGKRSRHRLVGERWVCAGEQSPVVRRHSWQDMVTHWRCARCGLAGRTRQGGRYGECPVPLTSQESWILEERDKRPPVNLATIAGSLGISPERVRQIELRARKKLQMIGVAEGLIPRG